LARPKAKATNVTEPKRWKDLVWLKAVYEKEVIPKRGDLATRIKKGGDHLEALVRNFVQFANAKETGADDALESYCALPKLYTSYSDAVRSLGEHDAELARELEKVEKPIRDKAQELADQCIKRSQEALHEGKYYRYVNANWGWEKDQDLKKTVQELIASLQPKIPFLPPAASSAIEAELIESHLKGNDSLQSWYALGLLRKTQGRSLLARLTWVDALAKYPNSGILLNAIASIQYSQKALSDRELAALYESAARQGSQEAWVNFAYIQLTHGNLMAAARALRPVVDSGYLAKSTWIDLFLSRFSPDPTPSPTSTPKGDSR
jgi:hypothetical protein